MGKEMDDLKAKLEGYYAPEKIDPLIELPEMIAKLMVAKAYTKVVQKLIKKTEAAVAANKGDPDYLEPEAAQAVLVVAKALSDTVPELGNE